jgi:putative ABC transport system ATP-binding protein
MLKATSLSHHFDYPLFENLDFSMQSKESVAVLGVSGSGKSTLLHILSSFLKPDNGTVELFDQSIYDIKESDLIKLRRHKLGLIFQQHYLFRGFTAQENLEVAAKLSNQNISSTMLEALKIDKVMHQPIAELSGGQQQRISIARVLLKQPQLIFADEPTGNLDKNTAHDVIDMMHNYIYEREAGLFVVTHDESIAEKCNHRFVLENQRLRKL